MMSTYVVSQSTSPVCRWNSALAFSYLGHCTIACLLVSTSPWQLLCVHSPALHIQCVCCGAQTMLCNAWRTQHISLHRPCQRNKHSALRHWHTTCLCTVANPRHTFAMLATPASVSAVNLGPFESNDHANTAVLRVTAPLAQWHCLRLPALPRKAAHLRLTTQHAACHKASWLRQNHANWSRAGCGKCRVVCRWRPSGACTGLCCWRDHSIQTGPDLPRRMAKQGMEGLPTVGNV